MSQKPHTPVSARSLIAIAVLGMVAARGRHLFRCELRRRARRGRRRRRQGAALDRLFPQRDARSRPAARRRRADARRSPRSSRRPRRSAMSIRFKLYNPTARQVLVSDDEEEADEDEDAESPDHNDTAAAVLANHEPSIELHDDADPGQPPLFVEAYVPIVDAAGTTHGVVEVYIDQTGTAALLRTTFAALAIGLAVIAALAFGLPTLAFLLRSRQASEARRPRRLPRPIRPDDGPAQSRRCHRAARKGAALRQGRSRPRSPSCSSISTTSSRSTTCAAPRPAMRSSSTWRTPSKRRSVRAISAAGSAATSSSSVLERPQRRERSPGIVEAVLRAAREPITSMATRSPGGSAPGSIRSSGAPPPSEALHRADAALYPGQDRTGGNGWRLFSPEMEASMVARRALEQRLRDATSAKSFELFFQPLLKADDAASARGSRRCSACPTAAAATFRPRRSFRSPSRWASSTRSAPGCWAKRRGSPRAGRRTCSLRSISRSASSPTAGWSTR